MAQDARSLAVPSGLPNLDLLTSGPIPPNPSELLNSERFREMSDELLASGYEHVVFDSPPALSVADPVIIANTVDFGILVVRAGRTPRQSVRLAAEKFLQVESSRFGVVLNDLAPETGSSTYGHYQHYGRYDEATPGESDDDQVRGAGA